MALRTGAEYLQALRDGREVYLDGRRVKDVTTEPGLSVDWPFVLSMLRHD